MDNQLLYPALSTLYKERTGQELDILNFVFKDDRDPLITREQLIKINETDIFPNAPGRDYTNDVIKPELMSFFREYVKINGWFYPQVADDIMTAVSAVRRREVNFSDDVISSLTNSGSTFLKSLFKSYWDVDDGPQKSFWDDRRLNAVVSYRLGLNNSKPYSYVLSDGRHVTCKETFDINIKNIRYGFVVQRAAVSWFKPTAAYEIYSRFLSHIEKPVVWDPSCGFGARLLGFIAAAEGGTYIGTDPAAQTFGDLCTLRDLAAEAGFQTRVNLHQECSESFIPHMPVDLVFTSPPYFAREKYFAEETQCWKKYPDTASWFGGYLLPTFRNARSALKDEGNLVINIDKKNSGLVCDAAAQAGFELDHTLKLKIGRDHFSKKYGISEKNFEPIFVFRKAM